MPNLITISHVSGQKPQVSFDKNLLKAHTKVSSHYLYSDEQNWRLVTFVYKHTTSAKRILAPFDGTFTQTVSCSIRPNMNNGEVYQLHKIIISGGKTKPVISIKRSEITNASSMDLTLGGPAPFSPTNVIWNDTYGDGNSISQYLTASNGGICSGPFADRMWAISTNAPGPYEAGEYTFVIANAISLYGGYTFGIKGSHVTPPPYNQDGVGFTGLFVTRTYGGFPTVWVGYINGIGSQVTQFNVYETNTVVFKREMTSLTTADFSIKVNGVEVFRTTDTCVDQPFRPAVKTLGQKGPDGALQSSGDSGPGIISAQRTS
jgi:hypothetical protein